MLVVRAPCYAVIQGDSGVCRPAAIQPYLGVNMWGEVRGLFLNVSRRARRDLEARGAAHGKNRNFA